jgi:hypothetical protein
MSDATEKIEWLIEHDDMARQIARNAINFGTYSIWCGHQYNYLITVILSLLSSSSLLSLLSLLSFSSSFISGKSYLRLEDYYCYLATSLHTLSKYQDANLTAGFSPQLLFEL